ncbi:hypothetical protein CspHIS471_0404470 [Cutaneotrichosporon sp. HIS471]|nr:hypothetical protein CspHIS471_0404470 [Cutaneotrichosporon sp. HIS471]
MSPTDITDDSEWTEGDFEITSSDGVRFKINAYNLFWASPVFAEAHASNKDIELIDLELETANILRLFFTMAI